MARATISFTLPQKAFVTISIMNALGQEVRTLSHLDMDAGFHRVVWDGKDHYGHDVPSGTYIFSLKAEEEVSTRRMTLIR